MPKCVTTSAKKTVCKENRVGGRKGLCKFRTVITLVSKPMYTYQEFILSVEKENH